MILLINIHYLTLPGYQIPFKRKGLWSTLMHDIYRSRTHYNAQFYRRAYSAPRAAVRLPQRLRSTLRAAHARTHGGASTRGTLHVAGPVAYAIPSQSGSIISWPESPLGGENRCGVSTRRRYVESARARCINCAGLARRNATLLT